MNRELRRVGQQISAAAKLLAAESGQDQKEILLGWSDFVSPSATVTALIFADCRGPELRRRVQERRLGGASWEHLIEIAEKAVGTVERAALAPLEG